MEHINQVIDFELNDGLSPCYNTSKCLARLASNLNNQCKNNPKNGIFCGIHMKSNNVKRIDEPLSLYKNTNKVKGTRRSSKKLKKKVKARVITFNELSEQDFNINKFRSYNIKKNTYAF